MHTKAVNDYSRYQGGSDPSFSQGHTDGTMLAWGSRVGLLVVSLALAACLAEVGSRLYLHYLAGSDAFLRYASIEQLKDHHTQSLYAPHRYLGYIPTAG